MKTQERYRTDIEFIDKDHIASMFMATCELNYVYDEAAYYAFIASFILNSNDLALIEEEAQFLTQKEIQRQLQQIEVWYNNQFIIDSESNTRRPKDEWYPMIGVGENSYSGSITDALRVLNTEKAKRVQTIQDKREEIKDTYRKNLKKNKIVNDWKNIGLKKIFDSSLKYQSTWTYKDVLDYFKKYGFPTKRQTEIQKLESNLNVCKIRHILRNDIMIDEGILLPLLEMQERKQYQKYIEDKNKFTNIIMIIIGVIITAVTAPFTGGQSGWVLVSMIVATASSIASSIAGIVGMVLDSVNNADLKEITSQTNDLMLKNMPKSGNFVDTSITDPYSMYANGRLWNHGGAGRDRYDSIKPHEPYSALDDKFKDSDMYDVLNYKNSSEKKAGGEQYFSNLYSDGKWVNPSSLKALLNGQIPVYLSIRNKITEAIFKWLSKEGLGTYYLFEDNWAKGMFDWGESDYIIRFHRIEFEDKKDIIGFTHIISTYYDNEGYVVGCMHDVSTKWDKVEDDKTQSKTHKITDHSRVVFIRNETKILKGKDIHIYQLFERLNGYKRRLNAIPVFFDSLYQEGRIVNENKDYACEYELWSYGGKEIKYYKRIKEVATHTPINITQTSPKVQTSKTYKFYIREEAKARIRFRAGSMNVGYTKRDFIREELNTPCVPYFKKDGLYTHIYRYFDKKTRFAYTMDAILTSYVALADEPNQEFTEVTIYHKNKDKPKDWEWVGEYLNGTTYFGISPFLNAKRNITIL